MYLILLMSRLTRFWTAAANFEAGETGAAAAAPMLGKVRATAERAAATARRFLVSNFMREVHMVRGGTLQLPFHGDGSKMGIQEGVIAPGLGI